MATARPGPEIAQAGERRLLRVESLRALAALGVLTAHIWVASGGSFLEGFGNRVVSSLGFGALLFFALSGALLYMPFVRRDFGGGRPISLSRYALNRAVRIFPLYYVALVAVLVVLQNGGSLYLWATFGLFLENFSTRTAGLVNGTLWTIVIELHFYILLPLIAWVIARASGGSVRRAMLVLLVLSLASVALHVFGVSLRNRPYRDPLRFSLPATFYLIGAGMMVALVRESWDQRPRWLRGSLASADLWLLASVPFWLLFVYDYRLQPVIAIACFLLLGAFVLPLRPSVANRLLDSRPLARIGLASYSLYIWQVPLLILVLQRDIPVLDPLIAGTQGLLGSTFLGMLLVMGPLSCAFALASYKLIEAPALSLRRRWDGAGRSTPESRDGSQAATAVTR